MPIEELPINGYYNIQRFPQYCPEDSANFYLVPDEHGKKKQAMYPSLGRKHVVFFNRNQLQFQAEPRAIFKSVNFMYVVVLNRIFRIDMNFNQIEITGGSLLTQVGNVFFSFMTVGTITFACFTDGAALYIYREDTEVFSKVTDTNGPPNPLYIATFANRLVVSTFNSSQFWLSIPNLGGNTFNPNTAFTPATFAQEDGVIQQMAVLHNTLYIFTSYTTGVWQNTPSFFSGSQASFPIKKNTSFAFDYGISDPLTLAVDFNMMVWLARSRGGLEQVMASSGQTPELLSTKAVDVLLQDSATEIANNPLIVTQARGFLYSYENTIFYRMSLGNFINDGQVDLLLGNFSNDNDPKSELSAFAIDFNFFSKSWNRVIESNGERNRTQLSTYFSNRHLVTVQGESTVYEMSGQYYVNELRNSKQPDGQAIDAYIAYPMRLERITPIISLPDYAEFQDDYVEIDFVFGDQQFIHLINGSFLNAQYIISETPGSDGQPVYIIDEASSSTDPDYIVTEGSNFPTLNDQTYDALFKPNISLYFSDDGGINFHSADNREFSQLGIYVWKMRWYQLGCSRNRVYKLICVAPSPIVVLGGARVTRRVSGGSN